MGEGGGKKERVRWKNLCAQGFPEILLKNSFHIILGMKCIFYCL